MKKKLIILGVTGSIGTTALNVLKKFKDEISIVGISAYSNHEKTLKIAKDWNIKNISLHNFDSSKFDEYNFFNSPSELLKETEADIVLNGIAGSEGLLPSLTALNTGKDLALANKESIVLAGDYLFNTAKKTGKKIIPVDSEHSAIYELINAHNKTNVDSLIITASGGPFRNKNRNELSNISVEEAINHPTWKMGPKISVDSATLANKGLEIIEAGFLFNFSYDKIKVVIHPQSIIHSMIQLNNGQIYAQMSPPDMAFPIINGIMYDKRIRKRVSEPLNFSSLNLSFYTPDKVRFPLLNCAFSALKEKKAYPLAYNIADEIAVNAFFSKKIKFNQIDSIVEKVLNLDWNFNLNSFEEINDIINKVKETTQRII